jgi:outer membrane protein OmpA-like peptidoglycan-associated protein
MRGLTVLILLLLSMHSREQNLVLNGDFESENICLEYQQNCAPEAWLNTVPTYPYFFEDAIGALHGNHYIGIVSGNQRMRVKRCFMRTRLLCGLRPGARYQLRCYVRADYPALIDSSGFQFSPYDMLCNKKPVNELEPTFIIENATRKMIRNGWWLVTYMYTGRGDEAYLSFGNFRKKEWGTVAAGKADRYMVYLDSVSLLPLDPYERLCTDWRNQRDTILAERYRHDYQVKRMYSCSRMPPRTVVLPPSRLIRIDTVVIPDVLFASNKSELDKKAMMLLDSLTRKISPGGLDSVVVEGHTDNVGTHNWNQALSEGRAASVGRYLEFSQSCPIYTRGWASTRPVADNRAPGGRRLNRRVEIYLYLRN